MHLTEHFRRIRYILASVTVRLLLSELKLLKQLFVDVAFDYYMRTDIKSTVM